MSIMSFWSHIFPCKMPQFSRWWWMLVQATALASPARRAGDQSPSPREEWRPCRWECPALWKFPPLVDPGHSCMSPDCPCALFEIRGTMQLIRTDITILWFEPKGWEAIGIHLRRSIPIFWKLCASNFHLVCGSLWLCLIFSCLKCCRVPFFCFNVMF